MDSPALRRGEPCVRLYAGQWPEERRLLGCRLLGWEEDAINCIFTKKGWIIFTLRGKFGGNGRINETYKEGLV